MISYHTVTVVGFTVALACCRGDASSSPAATAQIDSAVGAQTVLFTSKLTDLTYVRYDISPSLNYSYGFSIADYDGDGKPDISYFNSYTSPRSRLQTTPGAVGHIMWNNGENDVIVSNETFDFPKSEINSDEYLFERHVPIDINGDGRLDIVGVSNSAGAVVAYINPGAHGMPWARRVLSTNTPGAVNLTVADVNGDGKADVIVAMRYQPDTNPPGSPVGIAWLENPGSPTGEWIYHTIDTTPGNFMDPRTVQAGDIRQNGKMDVVVSDSGTGVLAWYEQTAPDTWTRHVIPGVSTFNAHFGRLVDMDGDGSLDILVPIQQGVAWVRNINKGASWEVHPIANFTDPNWQNVVTEVAAGDVHHDGSLDVVFTVGSLGAYTAPHSGGLYIAHLVGSNWQINQVYQTENNVVGVQLVDFDGSGYLDIVSNTEYQQNSVTLWENVLP
jgi:FG-GAP-like repeat